MALMARGLELCYIICSKFN